MAIGRVPGATGIQPTIVDAKGDIIAATAADSVTRLAVGSNDQRLVAASGEATGLKYVADTQNTVADAKGDLLVGTAADTIARLAVGTNGHTLVADSAETTGLKWQAAAGGFSNFTLLNTGGTAMTGATSITVNVTTKENYMILFASISAGASSGFELRINGDTGNNYNSFGGYYEGSTPSAIGGINQNNIGWARMGSVAGESGRGGMYVSGGSTTAGKAIHSIFFSEGTAASFYTRYSIYNGSAAITSFTFISDVGNFDAGTVYIWGGN